MHAYTCAHAYTRIHTHVRMHTHTHIHTHAQNELRARGEPVDCVEDITEGKEGKVWLLGEQRWEQR